MGFSRDEHPWVGQVPDKSGLYISAGYTGHGMVNTWLCGKTVALMVEKDLATSPPSPHHEDKPQSIWTVTEDDRMIFKVGSMWDAAKEIGLPESYLVTKQRILRAMDREDVELWDWKEVQRGLRARGEGRMASGYA